MVGWARLGMAMERGEKRTDIYVPISDILYIFLSPLCSHQNCLREFPSPSRIIIEDSLKVYNSRITDTFLVFLFDLIKLK